MSGYLATDPPPGRDRMDGTLVWTLQQLLVEWLGLDPTNDQLVDQRHIVAGRGRDYVCRAATRHHTPNSRTVATTFRRCRAFRR